MKKISPSSSFTHNTMVTQPGLVAARISSSKWLVTGYDIFRIILTNLLLPWRRINFQAHGVITILVVTCMLISATTDPVVRREAFLERHGLPINHFQPSTPFAPDNNKFSSVQSTPTLALTDVPPAKDALAVFEQLIHVMREQQQQQQKSYTMPLPVSVPMTDAATTSSANRATPNVAAMSVGGSVWTDLVHAWVSRTYARTIDRVLSHLFMTGSGRVGLHAEKRPAEICDDGKGVAHWMTEGRAECNYRLFAKFDAFSTLLQWSALTLCVIWSFFQRSTEQNHTSVNIQLPPQDQLFSTSSSPRRTQLNRNHHLHKHDNLRKQQQTDISLKPTAILAVTPSTSTFITPTKPTAQSVKQSLSTETTSAATVPAVITPAVELPSMATLAATPSTVHIPISTRAIVGNTLVLPRFNVEHGTERLRQLQARAHTYLHKQTTQHVPPTQRSTVVRPFSI